jgi:fructosamine-3-kinase
MTSQQRLAAVAAALSARIGARVDPRDSVRVAGGSVNESLRLEGAGGALFVKVAPADELPMFEAEAAGLDELRAAAAVRVPRVLAFGVASGSAYLALEWLELGGRAPSAAAELGVQLARQHRHTARAFGWHRDNTIGRTPQSNGWMEDWIGFFRERRLRFQLELAGRKATGRLQRRGAELLERMPAFFVNHRPAASLLHGDLWGGNWGVDSQGKPVTFDPAVYYGDREADIAMTRLFGGFEPAFRAAYQREWPLPPEAASRLSLYNLYHVLNHLNLFGGGYGQQAESMVDALLAELGH